jgi:hypothetical protein
MPRKCRFCMGRTATTINTRYPSHPSTSAASVVTSAGCPSRSRSKSQIEAYMTAAGRLAQREHVAARRDAEQPPVLAAELRRAVLAYAKPTSATSPGLAKSRARGQSSS